MDHQSARSDWESLHLFYHHGPRESDALLLDAIAPTMNDALRRRELSSWFFVRYWEGGPHFRIRFRDPRPDTLGNVHRALADHLVTRAHETRPLDPIAYYEAFTTDGGDPVAAHGWYADHSIERIAYTPELVRYGGPVGMAVSEDMFAASSQAALAGIRLSPERVERIDLALSMLLAAVLGLGIDSLTAVGWLRSYCISFSFATDLAAFPMTRLRLHAEREFFTKADGLFKRLQTIGREIDSRKPESSLICWWHHQIRTFVARYSAADVNRELSSPPLRVMQSQLHMFHNRLGISIGDECYLSWLVSLVLARADGRGDYFKDGREAPDREYHERSKYFVTQMDAQTPLRGRTSERLPIWRSGPSIALPESEPDGLHMPLGDVLLRRRSTRRLFGPVTLADLSALLRFAVGVSADRSIRVPGFSGNAKLRSYPSPGAKYPTDVVVYARNVTGLDPGFFRYDADEHALRSVARAIDDDSLFGLSPFTANAANPGSVNALDVPLWLFLVADLGFLRQTYGVRSYRLVTLECGHLAQNLALVAVALGMASIPIGGFYDDAASQVLAVDGVGRSVAYLTLVGRPRRKDTQWRGTGSWRVEGGYDA